MNLRGFRYIHFQRWAFYGEYLYYITVFGTVMLGGWKYIFDSATPIFTTGPPLASTLFNEIYYFNFSWSGLYSYALYICMCGSSFLAMDMLAQRKNLQSTTARSYTAHRKLFCFIIITLRVMIHVCVNFICICMGLKCTIQ